MNSDPTLFTRLVIGLVILYAIASVALTVWAYRKRNALRRDRAANPNPAAAPPPAREYRSRFTLLGLPFIHLRVSRGPSVTEPPVRAWIAVGDRRHGILFAFGGGATGIVAVGGAAYGLISFGGLSVGLISMGGFSVGVWALGGLAVGWQASGGCAVAWDAAMGGIAIAHHAALGALPQAPNVNNDFANAYLHARVFFRIDEVINRYASL